MTEITLAVVAGDGIGVDVTRETLKVLRAMEGALGTRFRITEYDFGAERYLKTGVSLPAGALDEFLDHDAIFMGAFGDPRVPD
ncbi:MAG: isocitrate/isopropylmalate family dehydrogenase, partial [Acidobacteriota bacterium]